MKRLNYLWAAAGLGYSAYRLVEEIGMDSFQISPNGISHYVMRYLYAFGTPARHGSRCYGGRTRETPLETQTSIWEEVGGASRLFWLGWIPIWATWVIEKESKHYVLTIRYIRGTLDPDRLVDDAARYNEESPTKDFRGVQRVMGDCPDVVSRHEYTPVSIRWIRKHAAIPVPEMALFDDLLLTSTQQEVVEDIERWFNSQEFYRDRNVPWRRGYLLYGPPGTGKSSFAQAVANHLGISAYVYDLSTFTNNSLIDFWSQHNHNSPRVAIFEDLDAVFHGRDNLTEDPEKSSVTWDCLLAILDGSMPGNVLTFVTTNHPDKLDASLAHVDMSGQEHKITLRPGRIDRALYFGGLDEDTAYKVAFKILRNEEKARRMAAELQGNSVASIQEACMQEALRDFWEEPEHAKEAP